MNEHTCPRCSSKDITVRARNKGFLCEGCGHQWPVMESETPAIVAPSGSTALPADTLSTLVLERFPFPIAWGYRSMLESKTASWAVDCAFYTYTSVLRLSALIFLAQFLQSQTRQCEKAAIALQYLRRPSLEGWFHVLNTLCNYVFLPQQDRQGGFPTFSEGGPFTANLVLAAKQFPKSQHNGMNIHHRLRDLRNERAHDSPWDEEECGRRLPGVRELLDVVLHTFIPLASITLVRQSPNGVVFLIGGQEFFTEQKCSDARMKDLFAESSTVLRNHNDDLLPLYPLFLSSNEPLPQGFTEPLLVFGGHGKKTALYLGIRSRSERQDTLARYQDLLRAKNIDPGFDYRQFDPWSISQWAKETSLGVVDKLKGVKYFPGFYKERLHRTPQKVATGEEPTEQNHGVDDAIRHWLDHGREAVLLVAADAGMGKTSLFCRLTEELLTSTVQVSDTPVQERHEKNDYVLLLLGGTLRDDISLFGRIRDGLGFSSDPKTMVRRFDELLTAWQQQAGQKDADHEQHRLIILLDAVNEAQDAKKLLQEIAELAAMAAACNKRLGRQFVRLLVSVRTERLFVLLDRWDETGSSGHFLEQPHNFAHFSQ